MTRLLCIAVLALASFGAHGEEAERLEALLGAEEYRAMGLAKLAPEERERLARWLLRRLEGQPVPLPAPAVSYSVTPPATAAVDGETLPAEGPVSISFIARPNPPVSPAPADPASATAADDAAAFGLEQTGSGPREFRARVIGEFAGWSGKTEFVLDNGQVWRQSTSGVYRHKATEPEVIIERSLIGYKLRLVETKRSISVRRIK